MMDVYKEGKEISSIEARLSWDRFLDKESLKNINAIHKRIFPKGYCISNDPQYVFKWNLFIFKFPKPFQFAIGHEIYLLKWDSLV